MCVIMCRMLCLVIIISIISGHLCFVFCIISMIRLSISWCRSIMIRISLRVRSIVLNNYVRRISM